MARNTMPEAPMQGVTVQTDLVERLEAAERRNTELEALLSKVGNGKLKLKVSQKGALSVYWLQRWPVTLYAEQWERLLAISGQIKATIKASGSKLTRKEAGGNGASKAAP